MSDTSQPEIVTVDPTTTVVAKGSAPMDNPAPFFDQSFGRLGAAASALSITGPAFARYFTREDGVFDLEVGFPVANTPGEVGNLEVSDLPGGRVAHLTHLGAYDNLGESWSRLEAWLQSEGLTASGPPWEVYVTEPSPAMDPADLVTELYWPIS